jgi:hypothetical protein
MMKRLFLFLALSFHLLAWSMATDFDCVVVGSSPISLLEALYQAHLGKKVLILEEAKECGGAWKSISICGVEHADLGCHQIGNDPKLEKFLEDFVGCRLVSLDNALKPYAAAKTNRGFYPAHGCFELIDNLQKLLAATDVVLLLSHKLESVYIDTERKFVEVQTKGGRFTTAKVITTPCTAITVENIFHANQKPTSLTTKYFHLYLLINDPSPQRFTYKEPFITGVSRATNLTAFSNLCDSGTQLIVLQMYDEQNLKKGEHYLSELKKMNLVDPACKILCAESYIYEQSRSNLSSIQQLSPTASALFEQLNTSHINSMGTYITKWKGALKPWKEAMLQPAAGL